MRFVRRMIAQLRRAATNPLLVRELRQRMRRARAAIVVTLYLAVLVLTVWGIWSAAFRSNQQTQCVGFECFPVPGQNLLFVGSIGRSLLHVLLFVVLMLVCLIVPGLTAGAISGERERQTLAPLVVTLMRPVTILVGKLSASLAFVLLLIVAMLPILSIAFWLGGASPVDTIKGIAMAIVTAIVVGSLGLFASTFMRRTGAAMIVAYGMVFFLTVGTFAAYGVSGFWDYFRGNPTKFNRALLIPNPFVATASVLGGEPGASEVFGSPFTAMQSILLTQPDFEAQPEVAEIDVMAPQDGMMLQGPAFGGGRRAWDPVPFWSLSILAFGAITAGGLWLAGRRLRVPSDRMR